MNPNNIREKDIEILMKRRCQTKEEVIKEILEDQRQSLDKIIDYILFGEAKDFEFWKQFWVFQELIKLGTHKEDPSKMHDRRKNTYYPFLPVNAKVISKTVKLMDDYLKYKKVDPEIEESLKSGKFRRIYEYVVKKEKEKRHSLDGEWHKYNQDSNYKILMDDLNGYNTGWCIEDEQSYARKYLGTGNLYIYFSIDENGNYKIPRIAIRTDKYDEVAEARGIGIAQNVEPEMLDILNKKIEQLSDNSMKQKMYNMRKLTEIDNKTKKGEVLTVFELRFLYELDEIICGFGQFADERVSEIRKRRNIKTDFAKIFGCRELDLISNIHKFNIDDVNVFLSNLMQTDELHDVDLRKIKNSHLSCSLMKLESLINVTFPEKVIGDLKFYGKKKAYNLVLPKEVQGTLGFGSLTDFSAVIFPEKVEGDLILNQLVRFDGLILPEYVGGKIKLNK